MRNTAIVPLPLMFAGRSRNSSVLWEDGNYRVYSRLVSGEVIMGFPRWILVTSGLSGLLAASYVFYRSSRVPVGEERPFASIGVGLFIGFMYAAISLGIAQGAGQIAIWICGR